jgi:hypothetical protein
VKAACFVVEMRDPQAFPIATLFGEAVREETSGGGKPGEL